jgi:hypothetical protein
MDQFETHFYKNTKRRCPMCGGRKFEFSQNPLGMFRVDARVVVKMPDLERGRAIIFVNCKEYGYYMFFKPEVVGIF